MITKAWRFAAIMLAALTTALAFCHLMEMPARLSWDASLWVGATVTGNVFRLFGSVGAALEVGTVVATIALVFLLRGRGPTVLGLSAAGAALFALALAAWWALVFPANQEFAAWVGGDVPADWAEWRAQWEYGHAARAVLQIAGLAALVLSALVETPNEVRGRDRTPRTGGRTALGLR